MRHAALLLSTLVVVPLCLAGTTLLARQDKSPLDPILDRIKAMPGQADKPFSLIVQFKVKREQVEAVLAVAKKVVPASRAEKGCVAYDVQQNLEDPTEFLVLETWRDAKALQLHSGTEHFAEMIKVIHAAVEEPPHLRLTKGVATE